MKIKKHAHTIDNIFTITIFLIFIATLFVILTSGAKVYNNLSQKTDKRYNEVTALSYISNKVRSYNEAGKIYITSFGGADALALEQTIDAEDYVTLLYCYNGYLMELYYKKGTDFAPGDGAEILAVSDIKFEYARTDLLRVAAVYEDTKNELYINLACE